MFCYPGNQEAKLSYFEVKTVSKADRDKAIDAARSLERNRRTHLHAYTAPKRRKQIMRTTYAQATTSTLDTTFGHVIADDFNIVRETAKHIHIKRTGDTTSKDSGKIFKDSKGFTYIAPAPFTQQKNF